MIRLPNSAINSSKEKNQIAIALLVYQFASNLYLRIIRKVSKRELPMGAMCVFKCKVCKSLKTVICICVHFGILTDIRILVVADCIFPPKY